MKSVKSQVRKRTAALEGDKAEECSKKRKEIYICIYIYRCIEAVSAMNTQRHKVSRKMCRAKSDRVSRHGVIRIRDESV